MTMVVLTITKSSSWGTNENNKSKEGFQDKQALASSIQSGLVRKHKQLNLKGKYQHNERGFDESDLLALPPRVVIGEVQNSLLPLLRLPFATGVKRVAQQRM
jgi:hypothetical protein